LGINARACWGAGGVQGMHSEASADAAALRGAGFVRASSIQPRGEPLMSGCPALDSLTGGICGGVTYLFSGAPEFLDALLHSILVAGCFRGEVAYMNNTDYYGTRSEISPGRIALIAKQNGLDYTEVLERIIFTAAYSRERQPWVVGALERAVRESGRTVLIAAHDISAFRGEAGEGFLEMGLVASSLWRLASETGAAAVLTSRDRGLCSSLVLDLSQVAVDFRSVRGGVRATLLRHPDRATPTSTMIAFSENWHGGDLMGRITPPFRQSYQDLLGSLRGTYMQLMRCQENRSGFELLVRDAWDREYAAMAASGIPIALDVMNLTANAHNKGEIDALKRELAEKEARIKALEAKVAALE